MGMVAVVTVTVVLVALARVLPVVIISRKPTHMMPTTTSTVPYTRTLPTQFGCPHSKLLQRNATNVRVKANEGWYTYNENWYTYNEKSPDQLFYLMKRKRKRPSGDIATRSSSSKLCIVYIVEEEEER